MLGELAVIGVRPDDVLLEVGWCVVLDHDADETEVGGAGSPPVDRDVPAAVEPEGQPPLVGSTGNRAGRRETAPVGDPRLEARRRIVEQVQGHVAVVERYSNWRVHARDTY